MLFQLIVITNWEKKHPLWDGLSAGQRRLLASTNQNFVLFLSVKQQKLNTSCKNKLRFKFQWNKRYPPPKKANRKPPKHIHTPHNRSNLSQLQCHLRIPHLVPVWPTYKSCKWGEFLSSFFKPPINSLAPTCWWEGPRCGCPAETRGFCCASVWCWEAGAVPCGMAGEGCREASTGDASLKEAL